MVPLTLKPPDCPGQEDGNQAEPVRSPVATMNAWSPNRTAPRWFLSAGLSVRATMLSRSAFLWRNSFGLGSHLM
jgi:hypothetical protein